MPLGADVVPQLVPQFKDMFLPLKPIVPHLHRLLEFHHITYKKKFKQTESSPSGTNQIPSTAADTEAFTFQCKAFISPFSVAFWLPQQEHTSVQGMPTFNM